MYKKIEEKLKRLVNNEYGRQEWVKVRLQEIPDDLKILDAGCGKQQYRKYCEHLKYFSQDFGKFVADEKDSLAARSGVYEYGSLDYKGNVWEIDEKDSSFDVILCTEVFEHILYPNETIQEFHRLLKPAGQLILTVPSNCLRHMDPYFYYSGFSDRYLERILQDTGFENITIETSGSYHKWLMVENFRSIRNGGILSFIALTPAFLYHYVKQRNPDVKEINTLCFGYHVTALKP